jgi:ATP-dependent RNA helicase DDX52/ROK1
MKKKKNFFFFFFFFFFCNFFFFFFFCNGRIEKKKSNRVFVDHFNFYCVGMSSRDAFASLTGGLHFKRSKYGKDMRRFKPSSSSASGDSVQMEKRRLENELERFSLQEEAREASGSSNVSLLNDALDMAKQEPKQMKKKERKEKKKSKKRKRKEKRESDSNSDDDAQVDVYSVDRESRKSAEEKRKRVEKRERARQRQLKVQRREQEYLASLGIRCWGNHVPRALRTTNELQSRYRFSDVLMDNVCDKLLTRAIVAADDAKMFDSDDDGGSDSDGGGSNSDSDVVDGGAAAVAKKVVGLTAIQRQVIPALCENRDVVAMAPTGSGKTAAFALPLLRGLGGPKQSTVRALVLSPTRELAMQIYREFSRLSSGLGYHVYFLSKQTTKFYTLKDSAPVVDVLVSTPMLLVHLIQAKRSPIDLSAVRYLVFDEADKLFELGMLGQIDEIVAACNRERLRSVSMFSATMLPRVEELAASILRDHVRIDVGERNAGAETIDQQLRFVGEEEGKLLQLRQMLAGGELLPPTLIFVQSKERARHLFKELVSLNINVDLITSDHPEYVRDRIVRNFRAQKIWVLIATDLLARGIDFKGIRLVVNFDFPQSTQQYIHRIGRTGRAGRPGRAITFFTRQDADFLRAVANVMQASGCDVPAWMLELPKVNADVRRQRKVRPPERARISTAPLTRREQRRRHFRQLSLAEKRDDKKRQRKN